MLQAECQFSKEEARDLLQALEELATNYDQRTSELEMRELEFDEVKEQISKQQLLINEKDGEVQQARGNMAAQRKRFAEMLSSLVRDIVDVGECMNSTQLQVDSLLRFFYPLHTSEKNTKMNNMGIYLEAKLVK